MARLTGYDLNEALKKATVVSGPHDFKNPNPCYTPLEYEYAKEHGVSLDKAHCKLRNMSDSDREYEWAKYADRQATRTWNELCKDKPEWTLPEVDERFKRILSKTSATEVYADPDNLNKVVELDNNYDVCNPPRECKSPKASKWACRRCIHVNECKPRR